MILTSLLLSASLALPQDPEIWEVLPIDPPSGPRGGTPGGTGGPVSDDSGGSTAPPTGPPPPPPPTGPGSPPSPRPPVGPPVGPSVPPRPATFPSRPMIPIPAVAETPVGRALGPDVDGWELWWWHNREAFLELDRRRHRPTTGGEGTLGTRAISDHGLRNRLVPRLLELLEENEDSRLTSGVLLSLGRIGEVPGARLGAAIRPFLADRNQRVCESACIALGVLGRPQDMPLLRDLLLDTKAGRQAFDRSRVTRRMRSFAAYSIGLIGQRSDNLDVRRYAVRALLMSFLLTEEDASPDTRMATVIANHRRLH